MKVLLYLCLDIVILPAWSLLSRALPRSLVCPFETGGTPSKGLTSSPLPGCMNISQLSLCCSVKAAASLPGRSERLINLRNPKKGGLLLLCVSLCKPEPRWKACLILGLGSHLKAKLILETASSDLF